MGEPGAELGPSDVLEYLARRRVVTTGMLAKGCREVLAAARMVKVDGGLIVLCEWPAKLVGVCLGIDP